MGDKVQDKPQTKSTDGKDRPTAKSDEDEGSLRHEGVSHLSAKPGDDANRTALLAFAARDNSADFSARSHLDSLNLNRTNEPNLDLSSRQQPDKAQADLRSDNGNSTFTTTNADGTSCTYDMVRMPDGRDRPRLSSTLGLDGSSTYSYPDKSSLVPDRIIHNLQSADGRTIQQERVRTGDGQYTLTEYEGVGAGRHAVRTEEEINVRVKDGQLIYQQKPESAGTILSELAQVNRQTNDPQERAANVRQALRRLALREVNSDLIAGDYTSAKEQFLKTFAEHGGSRGTAEKYINGLVNDSHKRKEKGLKGNTDDQIASALRSLTSVYEKDGKFSGEARNKRVVDALKSLGDPEMYNNQGQVGSCTLNSYLFMAEKLHVDKVAKTFAQIMTTGKWRGHDYTNADMSARNGRDSFNNMMTNAMASTMGRNHIGRNFPGAALFQGARAYRAITGHAAPTYAKDGIGPAITMGGAHCQVKHKGVNGDNVKTVVQNWWNRGREGVTA